MGGNSFKKDEIQEREGDKTSMRGTKTEGPCEREKSEKRQVCEGDIDGNVDQRKPWRQGGKPWTVQKHKGAVANIQNSGLQRGTGDGSEAAKTRE